MALEDNTISSSNRLQNDQIWQLSLCEKQLWKHDLVIGGDQLVDINKVKSLLSVKFDMKDMKDLYYFLVSEVIQTSEGIMISQWALHPKFTSQVRDDIMQAHSHPSRLKSKARYRVWHSRVSANRKSYLDHHHPTRPWSASSANSCKLHEIFIWIVLSECYNTWVERWTKHYL